MLTKAEFLLRVEQLHVSRKGNRTALYKPLMLLVLLARVRRDGVVAVPFASIEQDLRSLISRYSSGDSPDSVGQPWWHLPTDRLWQVRDESGNIVRESGRPREGNVPSVEAMRRQHGEFPDEIAQLLRAEPDAVSDAANAIVAAFLGDLGPEEKGELFAIVRGVSKVSITEPATVGRPFSTIGRLPSQQPRAPFDVDPDEVDRANQAHAATIDELANYLRAKGIEPRAPAPGEPLFDLAWEHSGIVYVAEVKSVTEANEEKQLRLGLGQVLRYRQALAADRRTVVAVLVSERAPTGNGWRELCEQLAVMLIWPDLFERLCPAL